MDKALSKIRNIIVTTLMVIVFLVFLGVYMPNVSATAQESAAGSEEILNNLNNITAAMEDVAKSSQSQAELAEGLNTLIKKFKIL